MVNKKYFLLFSLINLFLIFIFSVKSTFAGFGISPGSILNNHLKPGAKIEQLVTLSRSDPKEDLIVTVEPELGEMNSWFEFVPGRKFTFPKNQNQVELKVLINVPSDAVLKKYDGVIRVKAATGGEKVSGVSVVKGARMEVKLVTTKIDLTQLNVRLLKIQDLKEKESLKLLIKTENTGNTPSAPTKAVLEIKTLENKSLETLETTNLESVPPGETKELTAVFNPTVTKGQYLAYVKIYLDKKIIAQDRLVFTIYGESQTSEQKASLVDTMKSKISSYQKYILIFTVIIIVVTLVLLALSKKIPKIIRLSSVLLLFLGLLISVYVFIVSKKDNQKSTKTVQSEVENNSGSVKGAVSEEENTFKPLMVTNNGISTYPLYEKPEIESTVVYYAKENETFFVLDETSEWYSVKLTNGENGWLPKFNVKSILKESN